MKASASILTCAFTHIADELRFVEKSGVDMVHLDVMDGLFVPNLTFGPPVIAAMRGHTALPFDVHLMIQEPHRLIEAFAKAGADILNIHYECRSPLVETLQAIRALGVSPAITINPTTPAENVFPYLPLVDMVLVMTVEPGFGGQSFMADMLHKITTLRLEIDRLGLPVSIQVDGGIDATTAVAVAKAGANVTVVGSSLFKSADPARLVQEVQAL